MKKVDNKILESSDGNVIKRLVEVKQKLKSLKVKYLILKP